LLTRQHTTDVLQPESKPQLKSILEQNSLDEFMQFAEMTKKKFEAERENQVVLDTTLVIP
jgi:hypothetical protein